MSFPVTARNNVAASCSSVPARDTRFAQARLPRSSVDGIRLRGELSMIKTVTGISYSTGRQAQGELMFGKTDSGKPLFWL